MRSQYLVLLGLTLALIAAFAPQSEGYKWRTYSGTFDATNDYFIAVNYSGLLIYVGNALVYGGIYVGELYEPFSTISVVGWSAATNETKVMVCEDNMQILSVDNKEVLQWQPTSSSNVFHLDGLVEGGAEIVGGANNQEMSALWVGLYKERYVGQISSESGLMTVFTGDGQVHIIDKDFQALICRNCKV